MTKLTMIASALGAFALASGAAFAATPQHHPAQTSATAQTAPAHRQHHRHVAKTAPHHSSSNDASSASSPVTSTPAH